MRSPIKDSANELIDGGTTQAVPVDAVKLMGTEVVIAVNLYENALHYKPKSKISTTQHYLMLLLKNLASKDCLGADVTISPKFEAVNWSKDLSNREQLIAKGIRVTEKIIEEIVIKTNHQN